MTSFFLSSQKCFPSNILKTEAMTGSSSCSSKSSNHNSNNTNFSNSVRNSMIVTSSRSSYHLPRGFRSGTTSQFVSGGVLRSSCLPFCPSPLSSSQIQTSLSSSRFSSSSSVVSAKSIVSNPSSSSSSSSSWSSSSRSHLGNDDSQHSNIFSSSSSSSVSVISASPPSQIDKESPPFRDSFCLEVQSTSTQRLVDVFVLSMNRPFLLGRGEGVDLRTDHSSCSRRHALIEYSPFVKAYVLKDLNSANGTLLNGGKLGGTKPNILEEGDEIQFGFSTRLYIFHEPKIKISGTNEDHSYDVRQIVNKKVEEESMKLRLQSSSSSSSLSSSSSSSSSSSFRCSPTWWTSCGERREGKEKERGGEDRREKRGNKEEEEVDGGGDVLGTERSKRRRDEIFESSDNRCYIRNDSERLNVSTISDKDEGKRVSSSLCFPSSSISASFSSSSISLGSSSSSHLVKSLPYGCGVSNKAENGEEEEEGKPKEDKSFGFLKDLKLEGPRVHESAVSLSSTSSSVSPSLTSASSSSSPVVAAFTSYRHILFKHCLSLDPFDRTRGNRPIYRTKSEATESMREVLQTLRRNKMKFSRMAQQLSECPSRENGGKLMVKRKKENEEEGRERGRNSRKEVDREEEKREWEKVVEETLVNMKVGELSDLIFSSEGIHIIYRDE